MLCVHGCVTAITVLPPFPNSVDSGFSESLQLKPNVITVFVKGLDRRLKGGYGFVCVCVCVCVYV